MNEQYFFTINATGRQSKIESMATFDSQKKVLRGKIKEINGLDISKNGI
jgi:hypothetical protein